MTQGLLEAEALRAAPHTLVEQRFAQGIALTTAFFDAHAQRVAEACSELALRFQQGGRLLVFGTGAAATDAHHVAVEFVHPVLVGKRALPSIALASDLSAPTGQAGAMADEESFARGIRTLGRSVDAALGISRGAPDGRVRRGLEQAQASGLLTLALTGGLTGSRVAVDFEFNVADSDVLLVQEAQETMYHVMWELVHVFLDGAS